MLPKTQKNIISKARSKPTYAVKLKDNKNQFSPYLYLIKVQGAVKDIINTFEEVEEEGRYNAKANFEQSLASEALSGTGLSHYIMVIIDK